MFPTPDHLIRAYYESLGKLASPAALTITGMPQTESSADYLHTRHGDLVLAMRGLNEEQMLVLGCRFAASSGTRHYIRHIRTASDLRAGETLTGNRHPDDADLLEVQGVYARGLTNEQIAQRLQTNVTRVQMLLSSARGQILRQGVAHGLIEDVK